MSSRKPKNVHPCSPNFITWSHKETKALQKDSWVLRTTILHGHFPSTSNQSSV